MHTTKNILKDASNVDRNSPTAGVDAFCEAYDLDTDKIYRAISLVERCPPGDHGPSPALVVVDGESMPLGDALEAIGCNPHEAAVAKEIADTSATRFGWREAVAKMDPPPAWAIRELRDAAGGPEALADALNTSSRTVRRWVAGDRQPRGPAVASLRMLAVQVGGETDEEINEALEDLS